MFGSIRRNVCIAVSIVWISIVWVHVAAAATVYVPHLTGGDSLWKDYILVDNWSASSQTISIVLYNEGTLLGSYSQTVQPASQTRIDTKTLASEATCGAVTYPDGLDNQMMFRLAYHSQSGGGVAEFALSGQTTYQLALLFSEYSPDLDWKGVAVANFSETDAYVTLYAVGSTGLLGHVTLTIPSKSRIVGTYQTWFPGLAFNDVKKMYAISSTSTALSGVVVSGSATNGLLAFTTAQPASYTPGAGSSVSSVWNVEYDWRCDGSSDDLTITFYEDSSFLTSFVSSGTWALDGNTQTWVYHNSTTYTATLTSSTTMTGTMVSYSGLTGCFTGTKTAKQSVGVMVQDHRLVSDPPELRGNGDRD